MEYPMMPGPLGLADAGRDEPGLGPVDQLGATRACEVEHLPESEGLFRHANSSAPA